LGVFKALKDGENKCEVLRWINERVNERVKDKKSKPCVNMLRKWVPRIFQSGAKILNGLHTWW
jgi:hypothetical protein